MEKSLPSLNEVGAQRLEHITPPGYSVIHNVQQTMTRQEVCIRCTPIFFTVNTRKLQMQILVCFSNCIAKQFSTKQQALFALTHRQDQHYDYKQTFTNICCFAKESILLKRGLVQTICAVPQSIKKANQNFKKFQKTSLVKANS